MYFLLCTSFSIWLGIYFEETFTVGLMTKFSFNRLVDKSQANSKTLEES